MIINFLIIIQANDENSFCKDGYVIKILTVNEIKSAEEQEKRR